MCGFDFNPFLERLCSNPTRNPLNPLPLQLTEKLTRTGYLRCASHFPSTVFKSFNSSYSGLGAVGAELAGLVSLWVTHRPEEGPAQRYCMSVPRLPRGKGQRQACTHPAYAPPPLCDESNILPSFSVHLTVYSYTLQRQLTTTFLFTWDFSELWQAFRNNLKMVSKYYIWTVFELHQRACWWGMVGDDVVWRSQCVFQRPQHASLYTGSPAVPYMPCMAREGHGLFPDHLYLPQTTWEAR